MTGGIMHTPTGFLQVMENLESHGIYDFNFQAWKVMEFLVKAMESHGKAICVKKIKRQKDKKFGKITDELK